MTDLILAIAVGGAFGFALDRVGATNPGYIIKMLNLSDLHLMRTILLGIGVASILLFGSLMAGAIDPAHLSVKPAHLGVLLGGLLLGTGFAVAGYCPGTGLGAAATGRWDAIVFVLGGLAGAGAYMLAYRWIDGSGVLDTFSTGKTTLGTVIGTSYPAVLPWPPGEVIGLCLGIALAVVALALPPSMRLGKRSQEEERYDEHREV